MGGGGAVTSIAVATGQLSHFKARGQAPTFNMTFLYDLLTFLWFTARQFVNSYFIKVGRVFAI